MRGGEADAGAVYLASDEAGFVTGSEYASTVAILRND
jgi:hypothetical protein